MPLGNILKQPTVTTQENPGLNFNRMPILNQGIMNDEAGIDLYRATHVHLRQYSRRKGEIGTMEDIEQGEFGIGVVDHQSHCPIFIVHTKIDHLLLKSRVSHLRCGDEKMSCQAVHRYPLVVYSS